MSRLYTMRHGTGFIQATIAKTTKKTPAKATPSAAPASPGSASTEMDDLETTNKRLKTTLDKIDLERAVQIKKLEDKETQLLGRLNKLDNQKLRTATANGNVDVSDGDFLEINAGGKIIAVKRATLTQLQGSRLEAIFSGRWDKKLMRDNSGRIFLDTNGDCFQAIVDYLNELAISSEDEPPEPPTVDDELRHILEHQMTILGLTVELHPHLPDSNIIKQYSDAKILHDWLGEDGSDGGLELLYRSSRDGQSARTFHSECDFKGRTIVIIETTENDVVGGYTNTAWDSDDDYDYEDYGGGVSHYADKAFLFALSGFGLSSPCKMKQMAGHSESIYCDSGCGPAFGNLVNGGGQELRVEDSNLSLRIGSAYKCGPSDQLSGGSSYSINEMEVFQVTNNPASTAPQDPRKKKPLSCDSAMKVAAVDTFSKEVNDAINEKWATLQKLENEVLSLEESAKDEEQFFKSFASGEANSVVMLNVSGTMMATSRATLLLSRDSVLAQQFDDKKWTEQGSASPRVKDWTSEDVTNWVKSVRDVPDDVATLFLENEIKGSELLALGENGLMMIGVKRAGTICLLLKEIKQLEEASQDTATLIEYSPYCFGKILDYLRLKHFETLGLIDEPALPTVCGSQKKRFEKVVKYYFPGKSSKFILGG